MEITFFVCPKKKMDVNVKDLKCVHRLRKKYEDNETAYDALIYFLLTDGGKRTKDISSRIKEAVAFCRNKEGQSYYEQVVNVLEQKKDDIYDYSSAWAKAARHKDGLLSLGPDKVSPEMLAMQALSRFQKNL
jgi:hypothetical protein